MMYVLEGAIVTAQRKPDIIIKPFIKPTTPAVSLAIGWIIHYCNLKRQNRPSVP